MKRNKKSLIKIRFKNHQMTETSFLNLKEKKQIGFGQKNMREEMVSIKKMI